jgi:hypothetical protein
LLKKLLTKNSLLGRLQHNKIKQWLTTQLQKQQIKTTQLYELKIYKKKNKNLDRINDKEQTTEIPGELEGLKRSPMLFDLEKAIARAQGLKFDKGAVLNSESSNPKLKNEENRTIQRSDNGSSKSRKMEGDSESEMSVDTVSSKKSYASATSSRNTNNKKCLMRNTRRKSRWNIIINFNFNSKSY